MLTVRVQRPNVNDSVAPAQDLRSSTLLGEVCAEVITHSEALQRIQSGASLQWVWLFDQTAPGQAGMPGHPLLPPIRCRSPDGSCLTSSSNASFMQSWLKSSVTYGNVLSNKLYLTGGEGRRGVFGYHATFQATLWASMDYASLPFWADMTVAKCLG